MDAFEGYAEGVMMEGHELGGTPEQIRAAMTHWVERQKSHYFISRPIKETAGYEYGATPNPGRTNNTRLIRADYCRALVFGANYAASAGYGYDGQFVDMIDESQVDLGEPVTGPLALAKNGVFKRDFERGTVFYSDSEEDVEVYEPSQYLLNNPDHVSEWVLNGAVESSHHPSRKIGDGLIFTKSHKMAVADRIAGIDWMRSSPDQKPLELIGNWERKTSVEGDNPVVADPYWCVGPIYNTDITYGAPYSGHGDLVPDTYALATVSLVAPVDGDYDLCLWANGKWEPKFTNCLDLKANQRFDHTGKQTAVALRYVDKRYVKHASKWQIHASDEVNGHPLISIRDRCFGIELDGYQRPFSIKAEVNGRIVDVPIQLRGGFWGPLRRSFHFAAVFPEFDVKGKGVIKYVRFHAVSEEGKRLFEPIDVGVVA